MKPVLPPNGLRSERMRMRCRPGARVSRPRL